MIFNYVNVNERRIDKIELPPAGEVSGLFERCRTSQLYLSPPWIDFHCHIYHGVTSLGLRPDDIGYRAGVHLLVDAGSAGEETFAGFRDYVLPQYKTKVLAFLNISSIGLVSLQECFDMRKLDPEKTAACIKANPGLIIGVKARSSDVIVEGKGTAPLKLAAEAARLANCPLMVHFGENPPGNAENIALLKKGDIITHCFHGKEEPLWDERGDPIPELEKALSCGVILDAGHGAASLSRNVAQKVVERGRYEFIISTDLHSRSVNGPVHSLSCTMSKFLSLGMELVDTVRAVTEIPAKILALGNWCSSPEKNATIFVLREKSEKDPHFTDSNNRPFNVGSVIEPVAVIIDGQWIFL